MFESMFVRLFQLYLNNCFLSSFFECMFEMFVRLWYTKCTS